MGAKPTKPRLPVPQWDLWSATTMIPIGVRPDMLAQRPHIRQCRVLVRARTRMEAARKLVECGMESGRSAAAVSAWLKEWGQPTGNPQELAAVTDERVYVTRMDNFGSERAVFLPYPDCLRIPTPEPRTT